MQQRSLRALTDTDTANEWVGLQALTAFFIIAAAVAFAVMLRPFFQRNLSESRRFEYQPL
jgi:hypothetical protein